MGDDDGDDSSGLFSLQFFIIEIVNKMMMIMFRYYIIYNTIYYSFINTIYLFIHSFNSFNSFNSFIVYKIQANVQTGQHSNKMDVSNSKE